LAERADGGYVSERQLRRAERGAAIAAEVAARFEEAPARPLTEQVPEYVIRKDDHGRYAGLERRP
jgi:hypothetical protein